MTDVVLYKEPTTYLKPERFSLVKNTLNQVTDALKRTVHSYKYRPSKQRDPKMLVIVPAHNEEDCIADTLTSILNQTRRPDRIVVISDNSTDRTVEIVRRFKSVTLMETVGNDQRKVGALTAAWRRWGAGFDYVVGIDADTTMHKSCLSNLESELKRDKTIGGVCARFTFDQSKADSPMAAVLYRLQRVEFSQWVAEIGHRKREAYVLGGQCTMFRGQALDYIADHSRRGSPWDASSMVEDAATSIELQQARFKTMMSPTARAYAGAMPTLRSLWSQRLKWEQGGIRLMLDHGYTGTVKTRWHHQTGLFLDLLNRIAFILLVCASVSQGKFTFSPWWLIPPVLSVLVNLRATWRTPHRRPMDLIFSLLVFPAELYLWFQLAVGVVSWTHVLFGIQKDGWSAQYRAESGKSGSMAKVMFGLGLIILGFVGVSYGWNHASSDLQDTLLTAGWIFVAVLTILNCARMLFKLLRPSKGFKP